MDTACAFSTARNDYGIPPGIRAGKYIYVPHPDRYCIQRFDWSGIVSEVAAGKSMPIFGRTSDFSG